MGCAGDDGRGVESLGGGPLGGLVRWTPGSPHLRVLHENPFSVQALKKVGLAEGDVKELRVKIDVSYHLKLHALKLLRNKKMSDAIEEALDYYFEHVVQQGSELSEQNTEMGKLF